VPVEQSRTELTHQIIGDAKSPDGYLEIPKHTLEDLRTVFGRTETILPRRA